MNLKLRKAPKNLRLAPKKGYDSKLLKQRSRVQVKVVEYDAKRFLVGLKYGLKSVGNYFAAKVSNGRKMRAGSVEKAVRKGIAAGEFDAAIKKAVNSMGKKAGRKVKSAGKKVRAPRRKPKTTKKQPAQPSAEGAGA